MDTELIQEVQKIQLEIAGEIKRICDKHKIDYFMDGGTLLGAVRHKGFIPWDDDMDFGMTRTEFQRFLEAASVELKPDFFLQTWNSDFEYGLAFAKVRKNGTLYQERVSQKSRCHDGIFVDIFPYDSLPDGLEQKKKMYRKLTLLKAMIKMKCQYCPWYAENQFSLKKWAAYLPIRFVALFANKNNLITKYETIATRYNAENTLKLFPQGGEAFGQWELDRDIFNGTMMLPFEQESYPAPIKYDKMLRTAFGDYMTPPPIEKRESTHGVIKIITHQ